MSGGPVRTTLDYRGALSYVRSYSNDDVTMTIRHIVCRVGVRGAEIADVESRVGDRAGIMVCTQELSNLVPSCVLADFINCKCVTATVAGKKLSKTSSAKRVVSERTRV